MGQKQIALTSPTRGGGAKTNIIYHTQANRPIMGRYGANKKGKSIMRLVWTKKGQEHWAKKFPRRAKERRVGKDAYVMGERVEYSDNSESLAYALLEKGHVKKVYELDEKMLRAKDIREGHEKRCAKYTPEQAEERASFISDCLRDGDKICEIAKMLGVASNSLSQWYKRYRRRTEKA